MAAAWTWAQREFTIAFSWWFSRFCWNMELLFCSLVLSSVVSNSTVLSSSTSWNLESGVSGGVTGIERVLTCSVFLRLASRI
jgi:hypothetical protein